MVLHFTLPARSCAFRWLYRSRFASGSKVGAANPRLCRTAFVKENKGAGLLPVKRKQKAGEQPCTHAPPHPPLLLPEAVRAPAVPRPPSFIAPVPLGRGRQSPVTAAKQRVRSIANMQLLATRLGGHVWPRRAGAVRKVEGWRGEVPRGERQSCA